MAPAVPASDTVKSQDDNEGAACKHYDQLYDIGQDYGSQPAEESINSDHGGCDDDRLPEGPAHKCV